MAKRALVIQGGTMRGAFLVGAMKTIHRMLGPNYFDAIFSTSVGIFEQAFFASGQIYFMENTWREYVHGRQLVNIFNVFRGKPVVDLDYLVELFQSEKSMLDIEAMKNSHPKLVSFITDYETKEPIAVDIKNAPIFDVMRATCAEPKVYPKKVLINGRRYVDCSLAPQEKFVKLIEDELREYDEIIGICNFQKTGRLGNIKTKKVLNLSPSKMPLLGSLDTNRGRLIKTIEQGEKDAEKFILENNLLQKA